MKIMVCFDASSSSRAALKLAATHGKAFGADVAVVSVKGSDSKIDEIEGSEKALNEAQALLEKDGVPCKTHLLIRGLSTGEDLIKFASENNIDEILIGVKKTSRVEKLVFGSTARYVILKSACPVVSVK